MDTSTTATPPRKSRSTTRRSYPNLSNLSLAPLSSKYPLDASLPPSPTLSDSSPHIASPITSYIAQKSAPSTPGILSLSQSRSTSRRPGTKSKPFAYDGYFLNADAPLRDQGDIPKAKSTSAMLGGVSFADELAMTTTGGRHHRRKGTAPVSLRLPVAKHHTHDAHDEWFHRAGLAIAGETRESKGQSWLVRRESSTSLVGDGEFEERASHEGRHMALLSGEHLADGGVDGMGMQHVFTPKGMSRAGSRLQSRVGSRMGSARGSRRGSKADLVMSMSMPRTPSARHSFEFERESEEGGAFLEPDFVDEDESDGDEEEVARLARERGFGLGGWMDRLIGWTLFSVDEDGEESDEEDEEDDDDDSVKPENMTKEELRLRREVEAKRRKMEREAIIAASALKGTDEERSEDGDGKMQRANEENGGWQDAAWLFSVASKVIL